MLGDHLGLHQGGYGQKGTTSLVCPQCAGCQTGLVLEQQRPTGSQGVSLPAVYCASTRQQCIRVNVVLLSFSWRRQGGLPASSRALVTNEGESGDACWVVGDCQWLRLFDMMYAALK